MILGNSAEDRVGALAELLPKLTYEEMFDFAKHIADSARTAARNNGSGALDAEYVAGLLLGWAECQEEEQG